MKIPRRTGSSAGTVKTRYLHKDHLGSITLITDEAGAEVESFSFDPWGKRRAKSLAQLQTILGTWSTLTSYQKGNLTIPALTLTSPTTDQGFTGHRQLDNIGLIHMGGRVYDAEIGRFLSADPFVADSTNLQGLNRYSYVENNPLSYTDPSGYFLKSLFKKIGKALKNAVSNVIQFERELRRKILRAIGEIEGLSTVISIVIAIYCQYCAMAFNAAMADANGGTIGQILTGVAIGLIASGVPGNTSGSFWNGGLSGRIAGAFGGGSYANVGASLFTGGAVSKAQGGKFIDGVKGAVVGMAVTYGVLRIMNSTSESASADGRPGDTPSDTDKDPTANSKLVAKDAVYEKEGQLNMDVTVRNGAPGLDPLSDNAFNRQLDAIRGDYGAAGVNVNFNVVNSGPADLVYFSGGINGYSPKYNAISYTDTGAWSGTASHEFGHFLTGVGHSQNSTGSIRSYAIGRSVTSNDVELIKDLYDR